MVVYTRERECLLLERAQPAGFWQSVTGSLRWGETPGRVRARELDEETGLGPAGLARCGHCSASFRSCPPGARGTRRTSRPTASISGTSSCRRASRSGCAPASTSRTSGWRSSSRSRKVSSWTNRAGARAARADASPGVRLISSMDTAEHGAGSPRSRTAVVVVHGVWMRGAAMRVLRRRLEANGFDVHVFSYPSVSADLAANAATPRGVHRRRARRNRAHRGSQPRRRAGRARCSRAARPRASAASCASARRSRAAARPRASRGCRAARA